jgi:hypothetical protein
MTVLLRDPLRSSEAVLDLGLPRALAGVQEHLAGHDGAGFCGADQLGPKPGGWSSPM